MMRMGFYLIVLTIVGLVAFLGWIVKLWLSEGKMKRAYNRAIREARNRQGQVWKETASVQNLVTLYMNMVTKHGPDSEEAKSFRFGSDDKLVSMKGSAAKEAFEQQCDVIDATWRKMHNRRRYS